MIYLFFCYSRAFASSIFSEEKGSDSFTEFLVCPMSNYLTRGIFFVVCLDYLIGSVLVPLFEGFSTFFMERIYFLSRYSSFLKTFLNFTLSVDFSTVLELSATFFLGDSTFGLLLCSS
jgi:hypothetical protein